ncbi:MAG: flagellar filament capping protein FliD [Porticoccaceae bacterium]|nr:flagellar filament capping protein FliD [Porticoccaceae bacterium]
MVTSTGVDSSATPAPTQSSIGSSILLTLGSGSGINVEELSTNLVNAEKLPAENALQGKIDKTNAKISGYGLISLQLDTLATSFEQINDANEIYSTAGKSSNETAVSFLSVTNDAPEGGYDINVYQLAENQRIASNSYQTNSGNVNASAAFDITLSIGVTRTGTYEHSITTEQLQALGAGTSAYIEYSDGANTIQITQADIDLAMESLEGSGIYTFENASLEGLILAINNNISANAGFASNFASAEVHRTKGISFIQTTAGASVALTQPIASDGSASYSLGTVAQGMISSAPVDGSPASYVFTPTSAGSDSLEVSDGVTTVSVALTDFTARTDYELSITESELQTALANSGTISIAGSDGSGSDETVTVALSDMTTFGLPIPLGALTLQDLANAINNKASADFQTTAVVDDNKLTFVQKNNGTGAISSATRSDGAAITKTSVTVTSAEQMAEAIQDSSYYDSLKFTVSATTTNLIFDYKSDGVVSSPTFTLNGAAQTASSSTGGVNSVNSAIETTIKIDAGGDTLAGIVTAINNADTGVTASLLDVSGIGNDYRIVLSGAEGLDGSFSVTTSSSVATNSLGFDSSSNVLQAAQDAELGYEGLLINRGSNVISDVIDGATFQLNSTTGVVTSVAYTVLGNGSGGKGFAYDISKLDANTIRFVPKMAYVGQNLGAGPTGGPGAGYTATTIANPYGSDPANITVYDVTSLNNSDIDNYLDDSADPDYLGSVTLYDGFGGSLVLPRNGLGGFWPNGTTTENGETIDQYVATAQAASIAAGTGSATTGGTDDTYTDYTGGTINSVNSGSYEYRYTEAQLRADVAASIISGGSDDGEGALVFTDDYGRDHHILASEIRALSGGGATTSIPISNSSFDVINGDPNHMYEDHSHNGDLTGWTMTGDTGSWWIANSTPNTYIDESTLSDGPNVGWIHGGNSALEQTLSTTYETGKDYQFQVDIGDSNYYNDQGGLAWTVEIFAGSTLVSSQTGSSNIDAMATKTLSFDANNSSLNGQALRIKISKTDSTNSSLLVDNIRGTVTETGAGEETLAGLVAAIQAEKDYPDNVGSNNDGVGDNGATDDLRFTVALSGDGQGVVFTPQGIPRNPDSGMAMFSAKRTSSNSSSLYNGNNLNNLTGATGGSYTALQSTPGTPNSGNYSNTGIINSTVGTTGGGTFRIAWSNAQLQADLLSGRIENYDDSNSIDDRAYISFTDNDGDTIMVERSAIGSAGSETIAGLVTALQGATAGTNSNGFARSDYQDFDYNISYDASGLVFTPKTSPAIGDTLSLQMRRSRNDSEYTGSANDGETYATEEPLRHMIIEDRGLIPGTPGTGGNGNTYLTKYRTETVFDAARLTITRDKSQLKLNLQDIVTSYNDLESLIDELNTDEAVEAGLSLAGEGSLLRSVQSRIYNALTATSSTASGAVDAVRDLGISVNRYGKLQFDEAKYDTLIATNWEDVVTMLTADTTNQSLYGLAPKGLGQDVATIINGLSASTADGDVANGLIANRTEALTKTEEGYQLELTKLEARMQTLYQRYLMQFTAMETLMNSLNNTRDYMESQIDVITSAYDKN